MKRPGNPLLRLLVRALRFVPAAAWALTIRLLSSQPDPPGSALLVLPHLDKVAHAGVFFVLALLLRFAGLAPLVTLSLAVLWGVLDERYQASVPGRHPDGLDLVADVAGAVLALIVVRWLARRHRRAR